MNKTFADLPVAFKAFIVEAFKSIDVDGNFNKKKTKKPLKDVRFRVQNHYFLFENPKTLKETKRHHKMTNLDWFYITTRRLENIYLLMWVIKIIDKCGMCSTF